MNRLVGLKGAARSGKTEVSKYLQSKYGYAELSFADALKEMCIRALVKSPPPDLCWFQQDPPTQAEWRRMIYHDRTPFTRWLLQFIGSEIIRDEVDQLYWIKQWSERFTRLMWQDIKASLPNIVVPDLRFPNEAAMIQRFQGEIWEIVREDFAAQEIEHGSKHQSETRRAEIVPDRTITAPEGIHNLHKAVDDIAAGS